MHLATTKGIEYKVCRALVVHWMIYIDLQKKETIINTISPKCRWIIMFMIIVLKPVGVSNKEQLWGQAFFGS